MWRRHGLGLLPTSTGEVTPADQARSSTPPAGTRYPRIAAQVAAGVTPESGGHAPLDMRRYGADASGSKPRDLAMAKAIADCGANGGMVIAPAGLYAFADQSCPQEKHHHFR